MTTIIISIIYLETNVSFRYLHTTLAVQYERLIFAL